MVERVGRKMVSCRGDEGFECSPPISGGSLVAGYSSSESNGFK